MKKVFITRSKITVKKSTLKINSTIWLFTSLKKKIREKKTSRVSLCQKKKNSKLEDYTLKSTFTLSTYTIQINTLVTTYK